MRIAAAVLAAVLAVSSASSAPSKVQASGAVKGCVNVKTRALTIPAGTGPCKKGTQSVNWNVTGPAGPAGTSGFGLTVPGTRFNFFSSVVFDGTNLWVDGPSASQHSASQHSASQHSASQDSASSVAEVSPGSRSILRQFSGGKYDFQLPAAMAVGGGDLWVLNAGDNSVTELRTSDGAFVRRLAGARYNLSAKAVLAVADGRLWVANPARKFITEISASTGAVLGKISGAKYGFSSPSALDFAGGHLWVANATGDSVTEISASDGGFVRKLSGFDNPVVMASAGRQLWVLGQGGGQFSVGEATEVNPDTGAVVRRVAGANIRVGGPVAAVVAGGRLWVANQSIGSGNDVGSVVEIDTSDGAFVRQVPTGVVDSPAGLAFDGQHVWMTGVLGLTEFPADGPAVAGPSVRGCVDDHSRALTIPAAGKVCGRGTTAIAWQQDGPAGAAGAAGWPQVVSGAQYGFSNPNSITPASGGMWVTSPHGDSVTEITAGDGALVRRLAGSHYGFSAPVAAAANGNRLWVANLDGNSVTEINTLNGKLVRIISGARYGFSQPIALTVWDGDVWVANAAGNSVTQLNADSGNLVRVISAAGKFSQPIAFAVAGADLWVANSTGNSITEIDASNGTVVRTLSNGYQFGFPDGILAAGNFIFVANKRACSITEINEFTSSFVRTVDLCSGYGEDVPEGMAVDAAGHVWVAEANNGSVFSSPQDAVTELEDSDGSVVRQISDDGDGFDFKSAFPTGIAAFDGRVWVANPGGESVTELPQSGPATIAATAIHACVSTGTRAVTVPAADSACPTTAKAISWNLPGPAGTGTGSDLDSIFTGTRYQFNDPQAVVTDGTQLWVANTAGNSITEVNASDGSPVRVIGGTSYAFSGPSSIALDGSHVWVANASGNTVTEINASDGSLARVLQDPSYAFSQPEAVAFDGSHIWVANAQGNTVTEINASDGSLVRVISDQAFDFESPDALAFDGSNIWVANERGASVTEISAADGTLVRNITRGGLDDPDSFAFDGTHIWVGSDFSSDLTEINASDGSIVRAFSISCAKALAFDGTHLWLACGRPTEVDPGDGSIVGPQGDSAELGFFNVAGIAVADGHLWVTNSVPENDFPVASLAELPLG